MEHTLDIRNTGYNLIEMLDVILTIKQHYHISKFIK
jgi:hypothetical protein